MIVHVDPADPTPVYEQLRAQVARMVASGVLTEGTRLPTIRQLAADLGLAKGTVAKAYEALLRDGVVEAAGRRGTVVARGRSLTSRQRQAALDEAARTFALRAHQLAASSDEAHAALEAGWQELPAGDVGTAGASAACAGISSDGR